MAIDLSCNEEILPVDLLTIIVTKFCLECDRMWFEGGPSFQTWLDIYERGQIL